jgi:hypothetical protein
MEFEHPTERIEKALVSSREPIYTESKISVPAANKNTSHSVQKYHCRGTFSGFLWFLKNLRSMAG